MTWTKDDVEPRVCGMDGKSYPYPSQARRDHVNGRIHYLDHAENLSIRQIVATLAGEGFRVSVGTVHRTLSTWECVECPAPVQVGHVDPPEHLGADNNDGESSS